MIAPFNKDDYGPRKRYIPIPEWKKYYDWPKESAFRFWIFNAQQNGFNKVIIRVGRRILIDEDAFFDWLLEQQVK
jgi:hypothetical protein